MSRAGQETQGRGGQAEQGRAGEGRALYNVCEALYQK